MRPERNSRKIKHWAPRAAEHVTTRDMPISRFLWVGDPDGLGWVLDFRLQSRPEPSEGSCPYWQLSGPCWLRDHGPRVLAKWDSGYGMVLDQSKHKTETAIQKKAIIPCKPNHEGTSISGRSLSEVGCQAEGGITQGCEHQVGTRYQGGPPTDQKARASMYMHVTSMKNDGQRLRTQIYWLCEEIVKSRGKITKFKLGAT